MKSLFSIITLIISINAYTQDCIHCMYYRNYVTSSPYQMTNFSPVANYYLPWWYNYSMPYYSNYNYPGSWQNYGLNGNHYAHNHGGGMVGKPNLYVYGKNGTKFSIQLNFNKKSNLLAAVPSYENGWNATVMNNSILSNGGSYEYIYYDYGVDIASLQWEKGYCVEEKSLMDRLNKDLVSSGFNRKEIDDFNEYWSFKMPSAENYCVFPQANEELDKVVKIMTTPKATLNRLIFFIVPQNKEQEKLKHIKYFQKPLKKWSSQVNQEKSDLLINEWGIAFLDESHTFDQ
jgi:hypothetical protein